MNCKQVIVVRKDLNMRKGKIAAQVAHASMAFLLERHNGGTTIQQGIMPYGEDTYPSFVTTKHKDSGCILRTLNPEQMAWLTDSESALAKVVVCVESEDELQTLYSNAMSRGLTVHKIVDAGRTEFGGVPTLTCMAIGPHVVEKFSGLTDHLKLM